MADDWQRCDAMDHVGDEHDATVAWRDLGLMCDACYEAIVEQRDQLRQRQARARGLAEAIVSLNEKSYSLTGLREVAEEIVELLSDATDKEPT